MQRYSTLLKTSMLGSLGSREINLTKSPLGCHAHVWWIAKPKNLELLQNGQKHWNLCLRVKTNTIYSLIKTIIVRWRFEREADVFGFSCHTSLIWCPEPNCKENDYWSLSVKQSSLKPPQQSRKKFASQLIIAAMFKCLYPELSRVDSDVSPCDNFVFPESEWAEWAIGS